ncbi:hypothetical protein HanIR_Chr15g0756921 [Helianthus annuus]|nr:hypothetical protein HanIR_Chr15g0756921 [Helianthus annuus]
MGDKGILFYFGAISSGRIFFVSSIIRDSFLCPVIRDKFKMSSGGAIRWS